MQMRIMNTVVRGQLAVKDGIDAVQRRMRKDEGASAVEYALLVGLIAIVIIVAVTTLGSKLNTQFQNAASSI